MLTILDTLRNAQINLVEQIIPGISNIIGAEQLKNAITLLEKGYSPNDEVDVIIDMHESIENVPFKR